MDTSPTAADRAYTLNHFVEIARSNRFAENAGVAHQAFRCLICHPERCGDSAFPVYLEVIREAVKVRRPRLDQSLVDAINEDLALFGETRSVTLKALRDGRPKALACWRAWLRTAIETGLELLSVHSPTSLDFNLEEAEQAGWSQLIADTLSDLMRHQSEHRWPRTAVPEAARIQTTTDDAH